MAWDAETMLQTISTISMPLLLLWVMSSLLFLKMSRVKAAEVLVCWELFVCYVFSRLSNHGNHSKYYYRLSLNHCKPSQTWVYSLYYSFSSLLCSVNNSFQSHYSMMEVKYQDIHLEIRSLLWSRCLSFWQVKTGMKSWFWSFLTRATMELHTCSFQWCFLVISCCWIFSWLFCLSQYLRSVSKKTQIKMRKMQMTMMKTKMD